jgi:hypothetical protein
VSNGPEPPLADVLTVYMREHIPIIESSSIAKYRVGTLEEWWGDKELKDVSAANCRTYVAWREAVSKAKNEQLPANDGRDILIPFNSDFSCLCNGQQWIFQKCDWAGSSQQRY